MKANSCRQRSNLFRIMVLLAALYFVATLLASCGAEEQPRDEREMALSITSAAFQEGDKIPDKYTCQGQDISPPLAWSKPPEGTQSFTLIMDDPDAPGGSFTHWVIFNIPPNSCGLLEAVPTEAQLSDRTVQSKNDFGRIGYGGPCPATGRAHRYRFTLSALDQPSDLKAGASKKQIINAMQGHVLAQGELTGVYQR